MIIVPSIRTISVERFVLVPVSLSEMLKQSFVYHFVYHYY